MTTYGCPQRTEQDPVMDSAAHVSTLLEPRGAIARTARTSLRAVTVGLVLFSLGASGCGSDEADRASSPTSVHRSEDSDEAALAEAAPKEGEDSNASDNDPAQTSEPASGTSGSSNAELPAGATAGIDDVDGDGEPDPTCGTLDLGGGLVVRTLCVSMAPENEDGVIPLLSGSLVLAGTSFPETDNVDVTVRFARDEAGQKVTIFQLGSDTLFDSGSATIRSTAEAALPAVLAAIQNHLQGSSLSVRGHADSRGTAQANNELSQARAQAVAQWLVAAGGLPEGSVTALGLGSSAPAAAERTAEGGVSEIGQALNRRVEIVAVSPS